MTGALHEAIALPSFALGDDGLPGDDAIAAYERDGVVSLKGAFESRWIETLAVGMEIAIQDAVTPLLHGSLPTPESGEAILPAVRGSRLPRGDVSPADTDAG